MLYHRTQALYQVGDRISPGNWGRIILGSGPAHNRFFFEYMFEKIRLLEFPDKPSRMKAAFAFENFDFAQNAFRANKPELVYAVRIADPQSQIHRGDMSWIDLVTQYRSFEGSEECARRYWRAEERDPTQIELVIVGDLIVEDRLTKLPENGLP